MRRLLLASSALGVFATGAAAQVSSDLMFCSKLAERGERLACYDAAARIAETKPRRAATSTAATTASVSPVAAAAAQAKAPLVTTMQRSPFHGFYAALGGSYGWIGGARPYTANDPDLFSLSVSALPSGRGASGVAQTGYNFVHGDLLWGVELDGRWGSEGASEVRAVDFCCLSVPPFFLPGGGVGYRFNNDLAFHFGGRAGMTFDDTLIFAKLGIGVTRMVQTYSFGHALRSGTFTAHTWGPSVLVGVGIEQNFGRMFVRAAAEFEALNVGGYRTPPNASVTGTSGTDQPTWTSRATAGAGVRF